ncbi:SMI1/KNR4 family protein [Burkholderia sp. AU45274]|uniref:SMI1/KNR4 family protein n=1 Tax=Burkholderia sp. AU45274 TaxID=3059205 RepID=UPI00265591E7|nr:SMI1/KNR4 family protein [Burkholderia sp. AU45274]MDN7488680.1 SMI1/KNR4 family protein [Burkholderia sp. AU45274]
MTLVDTYLAGLRAALPDTDNAALAAARGATPAQLDALRAVYPQCPASLIELLGKLDGTYRRDYDGTTVKVLVLGSDVDEYPYFLLSAAQMLEKGAKYRDSIAEMYGDDANDDGELVDPRIDIALPLGRRLCFSHCVNNGGTSQLYLDFDPAPGGKVGQVVRFLHDPDNYAVIADDFDGYLRKLIDGGYAFVLDCDEE